MLLKRIDLENFGPYYGPHNLAFKGSAEELLLIHGENMAGKTSFLNAIRWCLYGEAKDRSGEAIPTLSLINQDAYSDGAKRVSVALEILLRKDGEESLIRLRRQHQAKQDIADPSADRDFKEILEVDLDGNVLAGDQFDDLVNSMLPVRISRFFLFDGELLKEYEELVHEDSTTHARQVQRAIEMILGVPAAQNGKDDLSRLHGELSRAYNKEARKHEALAESAKEAENLQDEVDELASELEQLLVRQEQASSESRATQEELAKHEHLAESARTLVQAEETIQSLVEERAEKETKRREHASELWRDVLEPRLQHEVEKLEREREQISAALGEKSDLDRELSEAETSLASSKCFTCGQAIPEEMKLRQQVRAQEIHTALAAVEPLANQGRLDELGTTIRRMREIAPAGVASAIAEIEADLARIAIQSHKAERMKEDTESDLRGFDKKVVPRFEEKRDRLKKHLWQIEQSIEQTEKLLGDKRAALRDSQRAMTEKDEPALRHLRIQRDLLANLSTVYDASIDELIADRRSRVEAQASSIFRELTTDKTYSGLAINRNYGLAILAEDGQSVPVRSAGAEQIVALSLIGALNRLAALRGPVIMDTPFGRLDRQHRENIMRFVPTLADQVVLLVHSGEIDPARDLDPVKGKVSAEFEIRHVESSRSEITMRER